MLFLFLIMVGLGLIGMEFCDWVLNCQGGAIMLSLIVTGWLLIGWAWGFVTVNRRAFRSCIENRYWEHMYQNWAQTHPGITAGCYPENKRNELRQNAILSPEAQEGCEKFISFVSQAVLVCSIFFGPIATLMNLKDQPCQWYKP